MKEYIFLCFCFKVMHSCSITCDLKKTWFRKDRCFINTRIYSTPDDTNNIINRIQVKNVSLIAAWIACDIKSSYCMSSYGANAHALSYSLPLGLGLWLETQLNANNNHNPNPREVWKCINAIFICVANALNSNKYHWLCQW